jgi:hypothetical protein
VAVIHLIKTIPKIETVTAALRLPTQVIRLLKLNQEWLQLSMTLASKVYLTLLFMLMDHQLSANKVKSSNGAHSQVVVQV